MPSFTISVWLNTLSEVREACGTETCLNMFLISIFDLMIKRKTTMSWTITHNINIYRVHAVVSPHTNTNTEYTRYGRCFCCLFTHQYHYRINSIRMTFLLFVLEYSVFGQTRIRQEVLIKMSSDTGSTLSLNSDDSNFSQNDKFAEVQYEYVPGKRKNSLVLFVPSEKQVYHRNTESKIGRAYVCQDAKCSARVYMKDNRCYKLAENEHLHGEVGDLCMKTAIIDEMKRKTVECNNMSVRDIYNDVMSR